MRAREPHRAAAAAAAAAAVVVVLVVEAGTPPAQAAAPTHPAYTSNPPRRVYEDAAKLRPRLGFAERLRALAELGPVAGPVAILVHAVQYLLLVLVRARRPAHAIEPAPEFPVHAFSAKRAKLEQRPLSAAFRATLGGKGSEPRLVVGGIW